MFSRRVGQTKGEGAPDFWHKSSTWCVPDYPGDIWKPSAFCLWPGSGIHLADSTLLATKRGVHLTRPKADSKPGLR